MCGFNENLYECDMIRSPFVYGFIFPKNLYIPFRLSGVQQQCVLHMSGIIFKEGPFHQEFCVWTGDCLLVPALVWIACRLMCRDMEMSCDEKVTAGFTSEMREDTAGFCLPLRQIKGRCLSVLWRLGRKIRWRELRNILDYRKPAKWKMIGSTHGVMLTMAHVRRMQKWRCQPQIVQNWRQIL